MLRLSRTGHDAAVAHAAEDGGRTGRTLRAVENFVLQHPQLSRRGLGVLRTVKPVLRVGDLAVVTRHADVREVLSRDDDFTVGLNTPKMEEIAGPFILGFQQTPRYEHDISVLRLAVPRADVPRIRVLVDELLGEMLEPARATGRLDLVHGVTDALPARLSARYFGVPGPDERTLVEWCRASFRELFYNIRNDPVIQRPARAASAAMRAHVGEAIAARKAAPEPARDDVLGRLLALEARGEFALDDAWIQTYLMGLVIGMVPLTSKASALAIDAMLDRPGLLSAAQDAARTDDDELLWRYLSEAMRIAPQSPGQFRLAAGDWTIGGRRATIPAGTRVFAATQSAMFDRRVFPRPGEVRTDRPASQHFHFGYGLHSCFGRYISYEAQLPQLAKAVLRLPGLRRASGDQGRLRWAGPFPDGLALEFDAGG